MKSTKMCRQWTLLFLLGVLAYRLPGAQEIPLDGYAAIVNDRIITVSDVMAVVQPLERQLRATYEGEEFESRMVEAFTDARESLIERALILEEYESQEGALPEQAIDERIEQIISERFNNDRGAFMDALAQQRITMDVWRKQVEEQIVISILRRQEVNNRINVSPSDVRELYEQRLSEYKLPAKAKLRMIVLNKGSTPEDQKVKREEAQNILAKLRAGEDFAVVARSVSEGSKAQRGGDWGWTDPDILRPELQEAVHDLQPGQISDIVEVNDELYIVKVEARQNASVVPFEEVQQELEEELRRAEAERLYETWINRLKSKYFVKIY